MVCSAREDTETEKDSYPTGITSMLLVFDPLCGRDAVQDNSVCRVCRALDHISRRRSLVPLGVVSLSSLACTGQTIGGVDRVGRLFRGRHRALRNTVLEFRFEVDKILFPVLCDRILGRPVLEVYCKLLACCYRRVASGVFLSIPLLAF